MILDILSLFPKYFYQNFIVRNYFHYIDPKINFEAKINFEEKIQMMKNI